MGKYIDITLANFESEVLQSTVPVLIDFWASWCIPCKMISPFIDEIAAQYEGRLKVGKVNVDEEGDLAGRHSVVSIPTLIVYKDGKIANSISGAQQKQHIEKLFLDLL